MPYVIICNFVIYHNQPVKICQPLNGAGADESGPGQDGQRGRQRARGGRPMRNKGCCKAAENLNVPGARRMGTGVIRQEVLITSRLSAPQAQDRKSFACPIRRAPETLRFSRGFADAFVSHRPPAPGPLSSALPVLPRLAFWLLDACDGGCVGVVEIIFYEMVFILL